MYEYQISVSIERIHLFRTEWTQDKRRARQAVTELCDRFGAANVTVYRRAAAMQSGSGIDQINELFA